MQIFLKSLYLALVRTTQPKMDGVKRHQQLLFTLISFHITFLRFNDSYRSKFIYFNYLKDSHLMNKSRLSTTLLMDRTFVFSVPSYDNVIMNNFVSLPLCTYESASLMGASAWLTDSKKWRMQVLAPTTFYFPIPH